MPDGLYIHQLPVPTSTRQGRLTCSDSFLLVAANFSKTNAANLTQLAYNVHDGDDVASPQVGRGIVAGGFDGLPFAGSPLRAGSELVFGLYDNASVLFVATTSSIPPSYTFEQYDV